MQAHFISRQKYRDNTIKSTVNKHLCFYACVQSGTLKIEKLSSILIRSCSNNVITDNCFSPYTVISQSDKA